MATFTNFKATKIEKSADGNQYILTVSEPSVFGDDVEHQIRLFSRDSKSGQISESSVAQTQTALRDALGNEDLIFTDPTEYVSDPNHIVDWLKANPNAPLSEVTQNSRGYYNIGSGSGSSKFGGSVFNHAPEDPNHINIETDRLPLYETLSAKDKSDYNNDRIPASKSGYKNMSVNATAYRVVLNSTANYQDQGSVKQATLAQVRDYLIENISLKPSLATVVEALKSLTEPYSFNDLLLTIGGTRAELLAGEELIQKGIVGYLDSLDRLSIRLYAVNDTTGLPFQTAIFKAATGVKNANFGAHFEFLNGDFQPKDLNDFFRSMSDMGVSGQEIADDLETAGFYDPESQVFSYSTNTDVVDALNAVFKNRKITVQIGVGSNRNGQTAPNLLSARVNTVGERVEELPQINAEENSSDAKVDEQLDSLFGNTDDAKDPFATESEESDVKDPFATEPEEKEEPESNDPFSADAAENPFK